MERKLYISDDLIEKEGIENFYNITDVNDVDYWDVETEAKNNGWVFSCDDMGDVYLSLTDEYGAYTDYEDLYKKAELAYRSKYYVMKNICELASVNYQTYKNSVANGYAKLSDEKVDALLKAMNRI